MGGRVLFGYRVIHTDVATASDNNVIDILQKALFIHLINQADVSYLYRCYKGDQPIFYRRKKVRPEINNRAVENRANEVVSFKVGYLVGEPVRYVSRRDDEKATRRITQLNDYALSEDKTAKDKELVDWPHTCGTSYRMALPDSTAGAEGDEAPFEIFTLDPRCSFMIYSTILSNPTMMGVQYILKDDGALVFSCYTVDHYYEVENTWVIRQSEEQYLGIPIIEHLAGKAHLGALEIVPPLPGATNNVESNRLDGVERLVQVLMLFRNVNISSSDYHDLWEEGVIKYKDIDPRFKAEVKYLITELNQTQTQTLVDSVYDAVLTIYGMPNRNGGSSISGTGSAITMRDGQSATEARAKNSELMLKKSEKEFLKILLYICDNLSDLSLELSAIETRFTRRNYENTMERANVLITMLNNPKIALVLAFIHCGVFSDPQVAHKMSMKYTEKQEEEAAKLAVKRRNNREGEGGEPGKESRKSGIGSGEGD